MESEGVVNVEEDNIEEIQEQEGEQLEVSASQLQGDDHFDSTNVLQLQVKGKYYKQTYRSAWEQMPDFKGWLRGVQGEPTRAYCTYCQKTLHAHRLSLLKHTCTIRHQKAAQIHNSRKKPLKEFVSTEESSSEDEGAKLNDKADPAFSPNSMRGRKSKTPNSVVVKTEPRSSKRNSSFKNSSDIEYYEEVYQESSPENYNYTLPKSILNLKKQRGLLPSEDVKPKIRNKSPSSGKKKDGRKSMSSTVQEEVNDAINQLQSLSDSIAVKEEDEFDLFGKYIASQLKQLSLVKALRAKQRIYSFLSDIRLAEIRENNSPNNAPVAYISVPNTGASTPTTASSAPITSTPTTSAADV